jgi:ribonuclease P/MRP protein subunit POP5
MDCLPVKNGAPCVFRVIHVSGTIRKVEEEAIRRARLLIMQAEQGKAAAPSGDALKSLFASDALDDAVSYEDDGIAQGASEGEDARSIDVDG